MIKIDGSYGEGGGQILRTLIRIIRVFRVGNLLFSVAQRQRNAFLNKLYFSKQFPVIMKKVMKK